MKELFIINRVMSTFKLQAPVIQKVQKKIYQSKKRTFKKILNSIKGLNSGANHSTEFHLRAKKNIYFHSGGAMKKSYIIGAAAIVAVIGTGLFFTVRILNQDVKPFAENKVAESASVTFVIGEATVKRENNDFTPLFQGDKLLKNDIVRTGKKSNVMIQVGNLGVMKILENTEFTFKALKDNGTTEAYISQGGVYSKIIKLEKTNAYRVKTPTAVAAVRGTQFLSQYEPSKKGKSEIQVLDGKVAVTTGETSTNEQIAENGKGVESVNGKLNNFKLSRIETVTLQKYAVYDYIDDLESKNAKDMKIIQEANEKKEKELDVQLQKLVSMEERVDPLEKLRKQGKPLTMVYLRDGSQIAGSIISADDKTMLLDTGEGAIKLPVAEILRRLPMK